MANSVRGRRSQLTGCATVANFLAPQGLFLLPPCSSLVVVGMRADPFLARRRLLELPERRLGLEPIDQEFAGLEGRLAVWRAHRHQYYAIACLHPAVAMDDQGGLQRPALLRLGLDRFQRLLG